MLKISDLLYEIEAFAEHMYGPYENGNNRQFVIIIDDNGKRRSTSYAKYILEKHLGEKIPDGHSVDHKNYDRNDNRIENLQILPIGEHSKLDTNRVVLIDLICPMCDKEFKRSPRLIREKSKNGKYGGFCSRSCSAKYNREVVLGKRKKLKPLDPPKSEYYKLKNLSSELEYFINKYGKYTI